MSKYNSFWSEPMGNKPVSELPGVGKVTANGLNDMGYYKAKDVYEKLRKFDFDEDSFCSWMSERFRGCRARDCFDALMEWHERFGVKKTVREKSKKVQLAEVETSKYDSFWCEPMGNKPVSELPGVGKVTANGLNDMGYYKAKDVYEKLRKFDFDEDSFCSWMSERFRGCRARDCFDALIEWHERFGVKKPVREKSKTVQVAEVETSKHEYFCSEPMGNKLVSELPGVGKVTANGLNGMGYYKAKDVYEKLRKFDFDEDSFCSWMSEHFRGCRARDCFDALMEWHERFGVKKTVREKNKTPERKHREWEPTIVRSSPSRASENRNNHEPRFFEYFEDPRIFFEKPVTFEFVQEPTNFEFPQNPRTSEQFVRNPRTSEQVQNPRTSERQVQNSRSSGESVQNPRTYGQSVENPIASGQFVQNPRTFEHQVQNPRTSEHQVQDPRTSEQEVQNPRTSEQRDSGSLAAFFQTMEVTVKQLQPKLPRAVDGVAPNSDPIKAFFQGMLTTVKTFEPEMVSEIKSEILKIITDYKFRIRRAEPAASTSTAFTSQREI